MEILVYNRDMTFLGICRHYESFIWSDKSRDVGDFELYCPATIENFNLLGAYKFIKRSDLNSLGIIEKIEIDTDAEKGDYIIATGRDVKGLLDYRIVQPDWKVGESTVFCYGELWRNLRNLYIDNVSSPADNARTFLIAGGASLFTVAPYRLSESGVEEEVSGKTVGEITKEWMEFFGWGYKAEWDGSHAVLDIYKGQDKDVVFTESLGNLSSTKYKYDTSTEKNSLMISATLQNGEFTFNNLSGYSEIGGVYQDSFRSFQRKETWINQSVPTAYTLGQLQSMYPSGTIQLISGKYYFVANLTFKIRSEFIEEWITYRANDFCSSYSVSGETFVGTGARIAECESDTISSETNCPMTEIAMIRYLSDNTTPTTESFEGTIIPDVRYKYRTDYNLEDRVTILNKFGISQTVRISESLECFDGNGYSLELKFK